LYNKLVYATGVVIILQTLAGFLFRLLECKHIVCVTPFSTFADSTGGMLTI
jgi:hypothetical protein